MADDEDDDDPIDNAGAAPAGMIIQPTNGAARAAPAGPEGGQGEGVQQVKHSDFKRIKEEQRAKGRQQALADLDAKAVQAGFASHDDALKALASLQQKKPAQPVVPTIQPQGAPTMSIKPKNDPAKEAERLRLEQARATDDKSKMRKQWRVENRKNRELQAQLAAKDAEIALREECYRAGVKDVDYTIRLLTRELQGKTQEEIGKYDRNAFYEGLKKDKPYLFGETVVAATTGTGGEVAKKDGAPAPVNGAAGVPPIPPTPGQAAVAEAGKNQFDARKASPQEISDRLRSLGLNPHL